MNPSQTLPTNQPLTPLAADTISAIARTNHRPTALVAFHRHWPEYLIESAELGLFMVSACFFTALLQHPASPARQFFPSSFLRMVLTGIAMGFTLLLLIHTPWGKRSGAHMNPATTLMFFRLGKLETWDALFYMFFQFVGGLAGAILSLLILGPFLTHPNVNFAVTSPGPSGVPAAFVAELVISFFLAFTVLSVSNSARLSPLTPYFAAALVAIYITFEAPFSGMSMNPARTLGSAVPAQAFQALWIYFTAPPAGMLIAAELYARLRSTRAVYCAKYHHNNRQRCIFRCRYAELRGS
jgi:aquaporin Z